MKRLFSLAMCLCLMPALCVFAQASGGMSAEPGGAPEGKYVSLYLEEASWAQDPNTDAWCLTDQSYCLSAVSDVQYVNIYIPGAYMNEKGEITEGVVNGYNAMTAPVILANDIGGFAQSKPSAVNRCKEYLTRGYVVVCPGVRGRDTVNAEGEYVGTGCAGVVDLKAVVRFLKYNDAVMPGDADCIVSIGRSAGGALSALLGSSGNNPAYTPYLEAIGAIMTETDDIYAAQCYCPITDVAHENIAYEWFYNDSYSYSSRGNNGPSPEPSEEGSVLNEFQRSLSADLAELYVDYVNGLGLSVDGELLMLDGLRSGTYYDQVLEVLEDSLEYYILANFSTVQSGMNAYTCIEEDAALAYIDELNAKEEWVSIRFTYANASGEPGTVVTCASGCEVTIAGLADYTTNTMGRNTACPAFDDLTFTDVCCALFAGVDGTPVRFDASLESVLSQNDYTALEGYETAYAASYGGAADVAGTVELLNPHAVMADSDTAEHFRIRTGTEDAFASLVEGMNLAWALDTYTDAAVDYALAWAQPHGDAEINGEDLFAWIEQVCKAERHQSNEPSAADLA